ncbi:hypothetical protein MK786_16095 [Microbacterium sp. CFH 31415]|uniref:hypothetical protein n=1 Tax=Microbacterium sp. CFH 31415 TaxID=2921732 RepID=UPI001F137154|nr:hypothetical protein [Microbacterium sp. CFH 31415]MCH6232275.1 hypothetical protein [Microbacterium sp. CFH 31415]
MPFAAPRFAAPRPAAADQGSAVDPLSNEPLSLPSAWTQPSRPPLPVVAAIVPIVGAIGLWLVTGSILSLWLAALGPLIAVATLADASRSARRDRRRHQADAVRVHAEVARAVAQRHDDERRRAWARHPDVASFVGRDDEVWRSSPGRDDLLVIGEGEVPSAVRITGGDGDVRAVALRARSSRLSHAPVTAPADGGVVVVGARVMAAAVQRALVIQLCLARPPGELTIVGPVTGELAWMEALPHRGVGAPRRLAVLAPGATVPPDADIVVGRCANGDRCPRGAARSSRFTPPTPRRSSGAVRWPTCTSRVSRWSRRPRSRGCSPSAQSGFWGCGAVTAARWRSLISSSMPPPPTDRAVYPR